MAGKRSPEYETFVVLQETLRIGIQNDIEAVVVRAFAAGLITSDSLGELTMQTTAKHIRAQNFLMMMGNKINECSANLGKFNNCLDPNVHENLIRKIGEPYL